MSERPVSSRQSLYILRISEHAGQKCNGRPENLSKHVPENKCLILINPWLPQHCGCEEYHCERYSHRSFHLMSWENIGGYRIVELSGNHCTNTLQGSWEDEWKCWLLSNERSYITLPRFYFSSRMMPGLMATLMLGLSLRAPHMPPMRSPKKRKGDTCMTSTKLPEFPPFPLSHIWSSHTLLDSRNLPYLVHYSTTPLTPPGADII